MKLTREKYAIVNNKNSLGVRSSRDIYADEEAKLYSEHWCEEQLKDCLENFDLNMEYLSLFNHREFCTEIEEFLKQNSHFNEVDDLNLYDGKAGYYLMVLDEYSQVYIGTTKYIKKCVREHWTNSKALTGFYFQWEMLIPQNFQLIAFVP